MLRSWLRYDVLQLFLATSCATIAQAVYKYSSNLNQIVTNRRVARECASDGNKHRNEAAVQQPTSQCTRNRHNQVVPVVVMIPEHDGTTSALTAQPNARAHIGPTRAVTGAVKKRPSSSQHFHCAFPFQTVAHMSDDLVGSDLSLNIWISIGSWSNMEVIHAGIHALPFPCLRSR